MARKPKSDSPAETSPPALGESGAPVSPITNVVTETKKAKSMAGNNASIIDLDINLEDYEDFEILPDGEYIGECTQAEVRTSDKGNSYFYQMWKIDPSEYPADYDKANAPEGAVMNYSLLQVPKPGDRRSITAIKKFFAALGLSLKTNTIDPTVWIGEKAKLLVGHEDYNGETRNRIKSIENPDA